MMTLIYTSASDAATGSEALYNNGGSHYKTATGRYAIRERRSTAPIFTVGRADLFWELS